MVFGGNPQRGYPFPAALVADVMEMQKSFPVRLAAGIQKETYADEKSDIFLSENMKLEQIDDLNYKLEENADLNVRLGNLEQRVHALEQRVHALEQENDQLRHRINKLEALDF